ncbi:MAG: carbohydrate-binding domain-containing protein [Eubacteriales bacterium]
MNQNVVFSGVDLSGKDIQHWDSTNCHEIILSDNGIKADADFVLVDGSTVTILSGGDYRITGTLSEGALVVDCDKNADVRILLDDAHLTSSESAALHVVQAGNVYLYTNTGTENTLASSYDFSLDADSNVDAAVFSKDDLILEGEGSLTVVSACGHGIVSKDDLYIVSGMYTVSAAGHGMTGKDSLCINDGSFVIDCGKDGIHAENNDDETLGAVYLFGGDYTITSVGDGISASSVLQIDGGAYQITAGGGYADAEPHAGEGFGMMGGGRGGASYGQSPESNTEAVQDETSADSCKGIKAGSQLLIGGGTFLLDTADDTLHTNGDMQISGGTFTLASGDDGMHADGTLTVSDGEIHITNSYEGIEGTAIYLSGGTVSLTSSDDGLNAAGGNDGSGLFGFGGNGRDMFASDTSACIVISGGSLYIDADGDGIDSNGSLTISGGEIIVEGPTSSGNGALDYTTEGVITGGVLLACGSSGMAMNFGSASTQGCAMVNLSAQQTAVMITLSDAAGNTLFSHQTTKAFNSVLISTPEMQTGNTYTLVAGDTVTEINMTDTIYGSGSGSFGDRGGMGGAGGKMDFGGKNAYGTPAESEQVPQDAVPGMPEDGVPGRQNGMKGEMGEMPQDGFDDAMRGQKPDGNGGMTPPEIPS